MGTFLTVVVFAVCAILVISLLELPDNLKKWREERIETIKNGIADKYVIAPTADGKEFYIYGIIKDVERVPNFFYGKKFKTEEKAQDALKEYIHSKMREERHKDFIKVIDTKTVIDSIKFDSTTQELDRILSTHGVDEKKLLEKLDKTLAPHRAKQTVEQ